jgi:hypothetical protein
VNKREKASIAHILAGLKEPRVSLKEVGSLIKSDDDFVILGTRTLGRKVEGMLKKINKTVARFIDLGLPGGINAQRFLCDGKSVFQKHKIIIASYHELEVAKHLASECGLSYFKDYIFFDQVKMSIDGNYPGAFGKDFYHFLKKEKDNFEKTLCLLTDECSRELYKNVLCYRVNFLNPDCMDLDDLPASLDSQKRYEADSDAYADMLSADIPEDLRKRIAFKISMNPYSYKNIVTPRDKRTILNMGAYDDTSVMFAYFSPGGNVCLFFTRECHICLRTPAGNASM